MAAKTKPTKTLNPLHFEDLEPHRFEDLIRQLIYDFRLWQSIEAVGRSGSDEGFDIRAWEKTQEVANRDEEDEENIGKHPMEGNLWMIQCKREKSLGPTRLINILNDGVDHKNPPYGYIFAAPVDFSKKSQDVFRDTLRAKGVSEFYMWGKAELEDMLSLPKNDHVLFTFFGISLVVRRRSTSTEVRFSVNNKNKLLRVLTDGEQTQDMYKSVLIRDVKDENYPWEEKYKDFDQYPRWEEQIAFGYHPKGLLFHLRKYRGYVDIKKKVYDFIEEEDLIYREKDNVGRMGMPDSEQIKKRERILDYWKHLPRKNQAFYSLDAIILFDDMLVIDDKGDVLNTFPHIFVDFQPPNGPFKGFLGKLLIGSEEIDLNTEDYKRTKIFPSEFPEIKQGKVYKDKSIQWDQETLRLFNAPSSALNTLFDVDGKYSFLQSRDLILVDGAVSNNEKIGIEITHKFQTTVKDFIEEYGGEYIRSAIERQVVRKVQDHEKLDVYEFEKAYEWKFKD